MRKSEYKKHNNQEDLIWEVSEWREYYFLTFKCNSGTRHIPIPKKLIGRLFRLQQSNYILNPLDKSKKIENTKK